MSGVLLSILYSNLRKKGSDIMKTIYFSSTEELMRLLNQNYDNDVIFKNALSNFTPICEIKSYFDSNKDFIPYMQS